MTRTKYVPSAGRPAWLVPSGLLLLAVIPTLGGTIRLLELASDPLVTEANARFVAAPTPLVAHILAATAFTAIGAFQFGPQRSRARAQRHRRVGRVLLPTGLVAASTGLWMTLTYPWPAGDGLALYLLRLVFGGVMAVSLLLSALAIGRRDFPAHAAWMTRGYAIGAGAGVQALLLLPATIATGTPPEALRAGLMGAGWVIALAVAEAVNRRRAARRSERSAGRGRLREAASSGVSA